MNEAEKKRGRRKEKIKKRYTEESKEKIKVVGKNKERSN